jgi:dienelactone hydrolase
MRTVSDAITFAQAYPGVDKEKIGILGTSPGASLGMMAASQDPRVTAVADFCGLIPEVALPLVQRMPPTLILHGAADPVVPVEDGSTACSSSSDRCAASHYRDPCEAELCRGSSTSRIRSAGTSVSFWVVPLGQRISIIDARLS